VERRFSIPRKIPEHDLSRIKHELNEILDLFRDRVEMPVDPAADALYHEWYCNLESAVHTKRLDTYALRLMPLLAANDGKASVDFETVLKATILCDWQLQVRKLHDPIDADNAVAKMEEWELKRATGYKRDGLHIFNMALKNLMEAGEVCQAGKGKSKRFYPMPQ